MSWRLSCPRCHSHNIKRVSLAGELHECQHEWLCQDCGDSCSDPCYSSAPSPSVDRIVGFAVLATLMGLTLCCCLT
jgi:transposase-like protein